VTFEASPTSAGLTFGKRSRITRRLRAKYRDVKPWSLYLRMHAPLLRELSTAGRLSRVGFWLRHCTVVPLLLAATIVAQPWAPMDLALAVVLTVALVSIWGRRLHDRGHSAWWLLAAAVPVVGALGLFIECALRGTSSRAQRFDNSAGSSGRGYLTVGAVAEEKA
jgi:uncharacterized membrane protein YhaH (DUF805 family)